MKRIASILLLGILLFNWIGYRILSGYLERKADIVLEKKLDNSDYDESRLIEIKVALNLPYQTNRDEFERFDGEIEVDGIQYKYVKRKVYNDSLILLCLPNEDKMKLQTASNNFFKLVNDLQSSQNKKSDNSSLSAKSPVTDYFKEHNNWLIPKLTALTYQFSLDQPTFFCYGFVLTPEQPPES